MLAAFGRWWYDASVVNPRGYTMFCGRAWLVLSLLMCAIAVPAGRCNAQPKPLAELPMLDIPLIDRAPGVQCLEFSPDGKWLATRFQVSETRGRVRVWKCPDWTAADADFDCGASDFVGSGCVFGQAGALLYVPAEGSIHVHHLPLDGRPQVIRLADGPETPGTTFKLKLSGAAQSAELGTDGKALLVKSVGRLRDFVRVDRVELGGREPPLPPLNVFSEKMPLVECTPVLAPDGKLLAVGVTTEDQGKKAFGVEVWSLTTGKRVAHLTGPIGSVSVVRFSPDGRTLAVGAMDGSLTMYDAKDWKPTRTLTEDFTVSTVDFHPTRPLLAFGTTKGKGRQNVSVVDLLSGHAVAHLVGAPHGTAQLRFSPDGEWLVTAASGQPVRVWKLDDLIGK
jgi:hypothetical protein